LSRSRSLLLVSGLVAFLTLACELALPIHETPSSGPVSVSAGEAGAPDAGAVETGSSNEGLLFKSGFEDVALAPPTNCAAGNCSQVIQGGGWPPTFWGGGGVLQLLVAPNGSGITTANIGDHMHNDIATVVGPNGGNTKALHQTLVQGMLDGFNYGPSGRPSAASQGDLYVVHVMKIAEDLPQQLGTTGYRQVFSLFQGNKILLTLLWFGSPSGTFWDIKGDSPAKWEVSTKEHLPGASTWFKLEIFWHPAQDETGRVWVAVDGTQILDRHGANLASAQPIDQVAFLVNSTPNTPSEQWVDDLEIWDRFPDGAAPH
jgi:hypothetical protein